MNRIAIYARVSTKEQNPENQLRELREYAKRRWEGAAISEYVDVGVSGANARRPELDKMMMAAKKRQLDTILVWKFDRFGRSVQHLVNALAEFQALDVAFISLQDTIDTTTPIGRAMFAIIGAFAEFERSVIQERIYAGLSRATAQGKKLGRPRMPIDTAQVRSLRSQGLTYRAVAERMKISKEAAFRACSKNPTENERIVPSVVGA